jgi:uncharacterized protein
MSTNDKNAALQQQGELFEDVLRRRISRRAFVKYLALGSTAAAAPVVLSACGQEGTTGTTGGAATTAPAAPTTAAVPPTTEATAPTPLTFESIQPDTTDEITVPPGYVSSVLLRWGDPLGTMAPEFDPENQTAEAQSQQFGYNCDFNGYMPLPQGSNTPDKGLIVVNHEYTSPELMFPGYEVGNPTKEQVDIEIAAHGLAIVEIERSGGEWLYNRGSRYNRRITGTTEMLVTGPAAGHEWLKTSADPTGTKVSGTLNNCAAGKTPWGTVVTAEENFHQYFANRDSMADDDPRKAAHERYGLPEGISERAWENFYDRFDLAKEPNEPFRFGWAVEIDPYDPNSMPKKRTTLGRFRHEAQTFVIAPDGRVVCYTGDDARFEYIYKFVTDGTYDPANRAANMDILDSGTLYVAKFNDDGSGEWMPLVYGQGPLTVDNGFYNQADVLVKTRQAADALGATKMDRPEDMEPNPVNKKVYVALTNNTKRGVDAGAPGPDAANPRADNKYGHIIEFTEQNDDHAALAFNWEIFILCGDPADPETETYFAGYPKERVSKISAPDNVAFDTVGNLWIATDGMGKTLGVNDGIFAVPVAGPERGRVTQFLSSVKGSEVCGPEFNTDDTALFLNVQHPGEGGTYDEPVSTWPDGTAPPRPSLVVVQAEDGSPIPTGMV